MPTGPQVVPTSRARGPGLGLRAAPAERIGAERRRGAGRGRAGGCWAARAPGPGCPRPRRGPARPARARSLGSHPTPRLLGKRKCLVEKNTVPSQLVSEPLLEKMLPSSFISRRKPPSTLPGMEAGRGLMPASSPGREGRGGEGVPAQNSRLPRLLLVKSRPGRPAQGVRAAMTSAVASGRLPGAGALRPRVRRHAPGGPGPGPRPASLGAPAARPALQGWSLHFE